MSFKPSDFFLTVTTFLGVLVPGAVLIFLVGDRLLPVFGARFVPAPGELKWSTGWLVFAVAAYVVGQILLAITEPLLNPRAQGAVVIFRALREDVRTFEDKLPLLTRWNVDRGTKFHAALSQLRLTKAEAASEIDHMMADYKLLRSLVAVFVIDLLFSLFDRPPCGWRILLDGVLAVLSFLSFARVYNWALLLAFQYCYLDLSKANPASAR